MIVLVDTPIWSFAYRRAKRSPAEQAIVAELISLIQREVAVLTGVVRQEILSGIGDAKLFDHVRMTLRGFAELSPVIADYERAAAFCNHCRSKGVQGSSTDYLLCAIAANCEAEVFTTDKDFNRYAKHLGVRLYKRPKS